MTSLVCVEVCSYIRAVLPSVGRNEAKSGTMTQDRAGENEAIDYGWSLDRSFLDKLLLALIDAHPEPEQAAFSQVTATKRRRDRLREARLALFPGLNTEGRPPDPDNTILRWMGAEHYRDIVRRNMAAANADKLPKIRSDRQLADEARKQFGEPRSSTERLRGKFGVQRKRWLNVAIHHDDVPEQLDHNLLREIADILVKHGIAMNLDGIGR